MNVGSSLMRVTLQKKDIADDDKYPGAYSMVHDGKERRRVWFSEDARHREDTTGTSPTVMQTVSRYRYKMVVDNDVWVTTK